MNTQRAPLRILSSLALLLLGLAASSCASYPPIKITIAQPEDGAFLREFVELQVRIDPQRSLQRILIAVRALSGEQPRVYRILRRLDAPNSNSFTADWNTSLEKDGPYQIEVEVLQRDGVALSKISGKIWVVNRTAQLRIKECQQQPLVAKDAITLNLEWVDALAEVPDTTLELFVQGKSVKKLSKAPYTFEVDLKPYADGQEISFNAVGIRGVYSGASAVCSILIDRKGPRVRFISPSPDDAGATVPGKFNASLEIEEEFGVKEVRILADGKVVGRLSSPPFQVPVDISSFAHGSKVTLSAEAYDKAGNKTENPPRLEVVVDSQPPKVDIVSPVEGSQHIAGVDFEVRIRDETGVELVDFYMLDERGNRLDNILHTTGAQNGSDTYKARVSAVLTLYGAGKRSFEVVARDLNRNVTRKTVALIFGCKLDGDCPAQSPPLSCLGNRCIVPRKLGDQCAFSYSCIDANVCHFGGLSYCSAQKFGICRLDCSKNQNCPPGFFCLSQKTGPSVCFPGDPCDPATSNCGGSGQCTPWGVTSFICTPVGTVTAGGSCGPYSCTAQGNCVKDHVCVPNSATSGRCHRICDLDFPTRDCKGNTRCTVFPLNDGGTNTMGYCQ